MYRQGKVGSAEAVVAALPRALKLLRERAGYGSLRPAAEAIRQRTGHSISPATLSEWDRGTLPVVDSLVSFLVGLGYDFRHLQATLEEVMRQTGDPVAELAERARSDPALRRRLRALIRETSADPDQPSAAVAELLADLDATADDNGPGEGEDG